MAAQEGRAYAERRGLIESVAYSIGQGTSSHLAARAAVRHARESQRVTLMTRPQVAKEFQATVAS